MTDFKNNIFIFFNVLGLLQFFSANAETLNEANLKPLEHIEWHPECPELPIERRLEDENGTLLIQQTFKYDELGRLSEETAWKCEDGPFYARHSFIYSDDGKRLRKISIESNNKAPNTPIKTAIFPSPSYSFFDEFSEIFDEYFNWEKYIEEDIEYLSDELFGSFFLHLMGYYENYAEVDSIGEGEINEKVRVTFINGILNLKENLVSSARLLSRTHGNANIHYVFRPTEGWSWDILKSSLVKFGFVSPQAEALAELWKSLIKEMGGITSGGTIYHYAHSMGGSNTYAAKSLLTKEEQKMIRVCTFGSPTIIPDGGFQSVTNYVSVRDGVGLLDPIGRITALIEGESHIIYVGNYDGIPMIDHLFDGATYKDIIDKLGQEFQERYGVILQ